MDRVSPFPKTTNFGPKSFTDDNFKFDELVESPTKRVKDTVGKGEIARYQEFLLFPQSFQKNFITDTYKQGLAWERVKPVFAKEFITKSMTSFH